jgi:hypothetical protein
MYGLTPFAPLIGMLGVRVGELAGAGELELAPSCVTGTCVLNQTNNTMVYLKGVQSKDALAKVNAGALARYVA